MIEVLLTYKWWLLVVAEILAWASTAGFFFARYWWESPIWEKLSIFLMILTGVLPHLSLAALDLWQKGEVSLFPVVIAILLVYSFTWGKRDLRRLDRWIEAKVAKWKGQKQ